MCQQRQAPNALFVRHVACRAPLRCVRVNDLSHECKINVFNENTLVLELNETIGTDAAFFRSTGRVAQTHPVAGIGASCVPVCRTLYNEICKSWEQDRCCVDFLSSCSVHAFELQYVCKSDLLCSAPEHVTTRSKKNPILATDSRNMSISWGSEMKCRTVPSERLDTFCTRSSVSVVNFTTAAVNRAGPEHVFQKRT